MFKEKKSCCEEKEKNKRKKEKRKEKEKNTTVRRVSCCLFQKDATEMTTFT